MSEETNNAFIKWLDAQEDRLGLSDYEVAKKGGFSHSALSRARAGYPPGFEICIKIADVFIVSPITVFRKAGLLPEGPENEALLEDWLTLLSEMSPEDQEELRQIARLKLEREQKERTVKKLTPRRSKS